MGLTSLPTRTSGSLGAPKVDINIKPYSSGILPAGEWNTAAGAIYDMAQQVGLQNGTTSGSLMSASFIVVSDSGLPNQRVLAAGPNMSFTDVSGVLTINAATSGGFGDNAASYLVVNTTASLANDRALTAGVGIGFMDGGPQTTFTISASLLAGDNVTITQVGNSLAISSSYANAVTSVGGTAPITSSGGTTPVISIPEASLSTGGYMSIADKAKLDSMSVSASVITVTANAPLTSSGGQSPNLTLPVASQTAGGYMSSTDKTKLDGLPSSVASVSASYLVTSLDSGLTNERVIAAGPGISFSDSGANGQFGISASLLAGTNVTINQVGNAYAISASMGPVVTNVTATSPIASSGGATPDISITPATQTAAGSMSASDKAKLDSMSVSASVITVTATAPLTSSGGQSPNLTLPAASTTAGGYMLASDKSKLDGLPSSVASVSASYVVISADTGLTSERTLAAGPGITITDYGANSNVRVSASLLAGDNITINLVGNSYAISSSAASSGGGADVSASYIVIATTASLPNERALTAGPGITITDNGANSTVVISSSAGSFFYPAPTYVSNSMTYYINPTTDYMIAVSMSNGAGNTTLVVPSSSLTANRIYEMVDVIGTAGNANTIVYITSSIGFSDDTTYKQMDSAGRFRIAYNATKARWMIIEQFAIFDAP